MATNNKYTVEQRQIMREIRRIQEKQQMYHNRWLEADIKLSQLKYNFDRVFNQKRKKMYQRANK